jgi:Lrp/AsnC family leucine-responsive transcriptional regulator
MTVDPAALGLPMTAFVRVRPAPGRPAKIAQLARSLGQVSGCHRITGEDCFLIKVHAPAVDELESALDRWNVRSVSANVNVRRHVRRQRVSVGRRME